MTKQYTSRGFEIRKFKDIYNAECSIQKSSLATKEAIWLGVQGDRMHVDKKLARWLIKRLTRFIYTGSI